VTAPSPPDAHALTLTAHAEGTILVVRAQPGARRDAIVGTHAGALRVAVAAPPDKGKANAAIRQTLAAALDRKPRQVSLLSGEAHREKRFLIEGLDPEQLRSCLASLLQGSLPESS
jgi:uncharacterized protein (TIGR00251 family)